MAVQYGQFVARNVEQTKLDVFTTGWTALQVGDDPKVGRRHLRIQVKAGAGGALALAYANATIDDDSNKTFTAPTGAAADMTTYPGNTIWVEPLGDNVAVYGRLVKKKGFTDNSIRVIVTEYA